MPGVRKKLKKKKIIKKSTKSVETKEAAQDPIKPVYVPPPPVLGERLLSVLKDWNAEKFLVDGVKVSEKVAQQLTPPEIRELRAVFNLTDMENKGSLNDCDVHKILQQLGFAISNQDLRSKLKNLTLSNEGKVSFSEFLELIVEYQGEARDDYEEIKQGFTFLDTDNDGKITFNNLKEACRAAGVYFSNKDLREMLEEADTNGDGAVDLNEFIAVMLKTNLF
ncbi:uncharacterized protein LOC102354198 [Latimeria chalumnae]|uniref:EF-hand domain-containing protein n=1 Tax=Latimeria chalumnae TaxID=7897 RepID=M3XHS1_LATCH|nr:PREDICTED: caltractin-like [Latimeria chalumnae]|eukprot:XP_014352084.1 PREDICTED: caltractin-like [Latimeria chalumnae]